MNINTKPLKLRTIDRTLKVSSAHPPRHRQGDEFLKGPIPLNWLGAAASLPGKTLAVGIAIWFKAGASKNRTVRLTGKLLSKFGVRRKAGYRGLKRLESAELVSVNRHAGRSPIVTILEAKHEDK